MGCFDVYAAPGQHETGYVLDVQADLLQDLTTRGAAAADRSPRSHTFDMDGQPHRMLTHSSLQCRHTS